VFGYAKVDQNGLLTIINGGFGRMVIAAPGIHQVFLVVRFGQDVVERKATFGVSIGGDERDFGVEISGTTERIVSSGCGAAATACRRS
jgi:hypothetical protein